MSSEDGFCFSGPCVTAECDMIFSTLDLASCFFAFHPAVCRPGTQEMPNVREFYGWFTAVLTLFEGRPDPKEDLKDLTNFPSKSLQTPALKAPCSTFSSVSKNKFLGASLVAHW